MDHLHLFMYYLPLLYRCINLLFEVCRSFFALYLSESYICFDFVVAFSIFNISHSAATFSFTGKFDAVDLRHGTYLLFWTVDQIVLKIVVA